MAKYAHVPPPPFWYPSVHMWQRARNLNETRRLAFSEHKFHNPQETDSWYFINVLVVFTVTCASIWVVRMVNHLAIIKNIGQHPIVIVAVLKKVLSGAKGKIYQHHNRNIIYMKGYFSPNEPSFSMWASVSSSPLKQITFSPFLYLTIEIQIADVFIFYLQTRVPCFTSSRTNTPFPREVFLTS